MRILSKDLFVIDLKIMYQKITDNDLFIRLMRASYRTYACPAKNESFRVSII